ncbi:MAG: hypothetical protein ACLQIB_08215, partial [Isosphaeraceae bacterium]
IHPPSGQCASIATTRRPYPYDIHFSQISCVNEQFTPVSQSAQSVNLEKALRLAKSASATRTEVNHE